MQLELKSQTTFNFLICCRHGQSARMMSRWEENGSIMQTLDTEGAASGSQNCKKINLTHNTRHGNSNYSKIHHFPIKCTNTHCAGMNRESASVIVNELSRFYGQRLTEVHPNLKCTLLTLFLWLPAHCILFSQQPECSLQNMRQQTAPMLNHLQWFSFLSEQNQSSSNGSS